MRKIDWDHYTRLLWWEKRVACALSLNQEPDGFERDHPHDPHVGGSAAAAIRRDFDKRMELLSQAVASQEVFSALPPGVSYYKHVRPAEFVKWAHGLGLSLPAELKHLIPATVAADTESVHAAAAQPADIAMITAPTPSPPMFVRSRTKTSRRDLLDPIIDALIESTRSEDPTVLYPLLRDKAAAGDSPFVKVKMGAPPQGKRGLKWLDSTGGIKYLSLKALAQRLERRAARDR